MRSLERVLAATTYAVPRVGEHGRIACWFGRHWWTLVRDTNTGTVVGVRCGVCPKRLHVHDVHRREA